MISVNKAIEYIKKNTICLPPITIELKNAVGYILSEDVVSEINFPPFRQSAMDGYAVGSTNHQSFKVINEIKAGDNGKSIHLKNDEAVRIFTGACVPDSAEAVVMQEMVHRNKDAILIEQPIESLQNIRSIGEQVKAGDVALKKGTELNPGAIGYLASLGITRVNVYRKPKVEMIVTGNELAQPGTPLQMGQIYESNSLAIKSLLHQCGFEMTTQIVKDDLESTKKSISRSLANNDLVILSGGISVGDYDFVSSALKELNVTTVFYKIQQKPGKPILFGKKNHKLVFALPGNPAATLTCAYMYLLPVLNMLQGKPNPFLEKQTVKLSSTYIKKKGLAHLLKGRINNGYAEVLPNQSSAMLSSFASANALLIIEADTEHLSEGEFVEAIMLQR
ncbi:MAG: gephyrin-like molybdotransferase Glp [Bacteroidia bacterium]